MLKKKSFAITVSMSAVADLLKVWYHWS